jgi:hypothetical protein
LLAFLDEDPGLGRLCIVEALGSGEQALERRRRCMVALIEAVDGVRAGLPPSKQPPPMTGEGVVGAVFSIVHARILERDAAGASRGALGAAGAGRGTARAAATPPLSTLLGELMAVIVLPYLGHAAAQNELHEPAPPLETKARSHRDPLEGLDMRLTYRTVRVLTTIAARPGASNRLVAEGSGISDQGQISKLLARLEHLGLVHNSCRGHPSGAPNAWRLTPPRQGGRAGDTAGGERVEGWAGPGPGST